MPSNVSSQEIFNAQNADEFLRCGFEVVVSNSKNNDTQNITGIAINDDGDAEEAFAGGLYVQSEKTLSGGYAANGLHNLNTPYMQLAEGGAVEGKPGDHTGIYACNTYDVNKLSDGGLLIINFPGKTLGLITPAGERTDYTELIVGEQYKFGEVNFANADISGLVDGDVVEIENGVFKKGSLDSVEAGYVYGKVHEFRAFTEGACHGTMGVIVEICRKAGGGSGSYIEAVTFFSGNATVVDAYGSPEIDFGQIEGLDFSVKTVELTMEKDGQTKAITLVYDSSDPIWTGSDGEDTYELTDAGGDIALHSSLFNESVVGEVYSITLSTESVEPNFKAAVAKTVESLNRTIDVSLTQADFSQLVTSGYATIDITLLARERGLNEDNALSCCIGLVLPGETKISLEPAGMWGQSSTMTPNYRAWVFDFGYSTSPKNLNLIYAHILFSNLVVLCVETGHVAVTAGLATN